MLVLSRRVGETIVVTDEGGKVFTVTVVSVRGELVRLGIDAPPEVSVDRLEIHRRRQRETAKAASKNG